MKKSLRFISILTLSSLCLLQSHSYAIAEVTTPEIPIPTKPLKSFSVIGFVQGVDSSTIKIERANGSDGSKNTNFTVNYSAPKVENQLYEDLNIFDISVGNKIIVQGGLNNGSIMAKRIIVFSDKPEDKLPAENSTSTTSSTSTASTTDELRSTSSDVGSGTNVDSLADKDAILNSTTTGVSTSTTNSQSDNSSSSTTTTPPSLLIGTSTDTTSTITSTSTDEISSTSTSSSTTTVESTTSADVASSTSGLKDNSVNPNDKNKDSAPSSSTPDPISSGSPIMTTPNRNDSAIIPKVEPEPDPVAPPTPIGDDSVNQP